MHHLLADLADKYHDQLTGQSMPQWISPMLATLTDDYFSDPDWIFERKLDGERCLAYRRDGKVKLGSRNKKDLTGKYPELVDALAGKDPDFIADGEIVAFDGKVTSYARLQPRMHVKEPDEQAIKETPVYYYLFDLIHMAGYDLSQLPLRKRKSLLRQLLRYEDPIRLVSHRNEEGEAYREEACRKGWEGVIAKQADSTYQHSRSKQWLKFKCVAQQELVIGGYTDPQGERIGFGAILVGYYEDDELRYAGKVGTGFDDETLRYLHRKMKSRERKTSPFTGEIRGDSIHWITPELVAEVKFTEWTREGKLRHPRYEGLRDDKPAEEVRREKPQKA